MSQPFNTDSTVARVRGYLVDLQARIIGALEAVEGAGGACAVTDPWHKAPGEPLQGDGITRIDGVTCQGQPLAHMPRAAR